MSEILIHYDYNGGYFCREHYVPCSAFGIGRGVDGAVKDWIKKNCGWRLEERQYVNLRGYKFLLMDEQSEKDFGGEITQETLQEWEKWANALPPEEFLKGGKCPHCGNFPFTPYTPSHYE